MNTLIETANSLLWGRFTVALILCCGIYHTVKSGFIQLKLPKHLFSSDGKNRLGAVTSALAASLGTGNITGCAAAIAAGGAGAVFWMWLSALGGMALAYSENRIGAEFGERYPKSARGPMLYIEKGMGAKWLAAAYAVCCLGAAIFMGSMSQSGALSDALSAQTPLPRYICSLAAAVVTAAVLFSSDRAAEGVMKFSARIVPVMGLLYVGGCIGLLIISKCDVSGAFADIFSQAFSLKAAAGGAAGITLKKVVSVGLRRGIFSNEAGMGSSVLVHSEADFGEPQAAGAWAAFEVFLDTIVCCTLTALVIICCKTNDITAAFSYCFGRWGGGFVCLCICMFALASVLGWSCYGEKNACATSRESTAEKWCRLVFCLACAAGGFIATESVFGISDLFNCLLMIINLPVITVLTMRSGK
ncbi:MAG: amino acid carrier protein [Ruminococcus sp.]|nr:MAG: amino acid carrier protein [Ruminococcus sp.]